MLSASGSREHSLGQLLGRVRFRAGPLAQPAGQQLMSLVGGQHVQRDQPGAFRRGQPGQPRPAGHQGQAGPAARQQRPHLGGVTRVVQDDQHPLAGQHAPVQGGLRVDAVRYLLLGDPERAEEPAQRIPGATGVPDGSKPRRLTYSWPSGNSPALWCAQCTARAVLPAPAVPPMTRTLTAPSAEAASCCQACSSASSAVRPAKWATPAGSCRGTTVAWAAGAAPARPGRDGPAPTVGLPLAAAVRSAGWPRPAPARAARGPAAAALVVTAPLTARAA